MKRKLFTLLAICILSFTFYGCGSDPEMIKFKADIDKMCTDISDIDTKMNEIDPASDTAVKDLLQCLDELEMKFKRFAEIDFPTEYDNLEPLTAEASDYMKEAVKYYHESFNNGEYNEYTGEYADANYERAYKRIQVIVSYLRGEEITE